MVLVPFGPLRWYRLVRYDGTDCSATVVPIDRYYQKRVVLADLAHMLRLLYHLYYFHYGVVMRVALVL